MSLINVEREYLKRIFPSEKWRKKVDGWSDNQVIAVYLRFKNQGKL